ncbi:putative nucleotidyltransferase with HDIG domain [Desulfohalotomaculum tongense]|uniref:HDIG domain-containing metalloprotein n=1 Tax=Desulforadius tongensis TaxID=1216062 RepID=UPI00195DC5CE|nr:putative nucleotidyltransferase with HDIG domain [Desulforadius tongensis]
MNRNEALELLKKNLKNKNLIKHCLAVEAVMARLAEHFGEDEEKWALAGLLHDIDYDYTKDDPHKHSLMGADMLAEAGLPEDVVYAVKVHNEAHGLPRNSRMDKALYATDPLTGLITAAALIRPEKSLFALDVQSLLKRYKEKSFARGANREIIASCRELELSLEEFMGLGLEAMQGIAGDLGLA